MKDINEWMKLMKACMHACMEWMNAWVNGWMDAWMDEFEIVEINELNDVWVHEGTGYMNQRMKWDEMRWNEMNEYSNDWMNKCMNEWNAWMNEWKNEWIELHWT